MEENPDTSRTYSQPEEDNTRDNPGLGWMHRTEGQMEVDKQAATPEAPQKVTYMNLNQLDSAQETTEPSSSLSEEHNGLSGHAGRAPQAMAASNAILVLAVLFGLRIPPKPSIWADPGPRVPKGSSVTIWCRGSPKASEFRLHTVRDSEWEYMEESPAHSGQAYVSLGAMNVHKTGKYQCSYSSAHHPEQRSDPLALVLTGLFPAPLLEAHPSPVVASGRSVSLSCSSTADDLESILETSVESSRFPNGSSVTIWCRGPQKASEIRLFKVRDSEWEYMEESPANNSQTYISLRNMSVKGQGSTNVRVFDPPSLSVQPAPQVQSEGYVTLRCHSHKFNIFALTRVYAPPHDLRGQPSPDFILGPVSASQGGQYRCFGRHQLDLLWSEPSGPLDILVAVDHGQPEQPPLHPITSAGPGTGSSPELQALSEPHVPMGRNFTLRCRLTDIEDTFYLAQDGSTTEPLQCLLPHPAAPSQANFTLRGLGPAQNVTYRCSSSNSSAPHLLSPPSQPLWLQVSGLSVKKLTLENLIRTGLGVLVLVLLLCEACQSEPRHQQGCGSVEMNSPSDWRQEHH
ncbi:leukocyte immunoglobulin-like receptor subfamily A member 2 [Suncus etruscus]|uniref:leukocyte immunoglobulin-like receptor subfamily A member 2 n=1 Tax=Suncus etruscus TaxID=109475 RepID=UPI002110162E|nr:leukocyte immunoglobulin-like receptor subfamily A member 2 [Suncus etruscus]